MPQLVDGVWETGEVAASETRGGAFHREPTRFRRWITETDVTNMRVVHKEGFIKRRTFEMSLDKVEIVDVDQSILGRIFGWGDVTIRGVGEGVERVKMIGSPIEFRSHITAR